ncbi:MAG: LON peptidase substrate-binding domain-containing protein, partial [Desulfofustis sp.]
MAEKPTIITEDGDIEVEQEGAKNKSQELLPAPDVLPESLLVIPLFDRPMFPKMMGPIMVEDPRIQRMILQAQEKGLVIYLGLLLVRQTDDAVTHAPESIDDFHTTGVAAKVVQISPPSQENPLQMVAQAQERFVVKELIREKPVFKAIVEYVGDEDG